MVSLFFAVSFVTIVGVAFISILCAFTPDLTPDLKKFGPTRTTNSTEVSKYTVTATLSNANLLCSIHVTDDFSLFASALCAKGVCTLKTSSDYVYVRCYDTSGNFAAGAAIAVDASRARPMYPLPPLFRTGHSTFERIVKGVMKQSVFAQKHGDIIFQSS